MEVTPRLRRSLRLQGTLSVALFLAVVALIGWLSAVYTYEADWTAGNRHTLSEPSRELLERAQAPITITAYATEDSRLREQIQRFVGRYQRADGAEVRLRFINPDARPAKVREMGIQRNGQLVVSYQGRTEKAEERSEQAVSQALQRLMRSGERQVYFLTGHGERAIEGQGRGSLARFARAVEETGAQADPLNLAEEGGIPEDTALLVLADPQQPLLEAEVERIRDYIDGGGNLLWLADKGVPDSLVPLAQALGVELDAEGTAVDPRAQLFGIQDPTRVLISSYPAHPATEGLEGISTFPGATHIRTEPPEAWTAEPLVRTSGEAWLETGSLEGEIAFDAEADRDGPLTLAVALTRSAGSATGGEAAADGGEPGSTGASAGPSSAEAGASSGSEVGPGAGTGGREASAAQQKVVVAADGDFLSNAYLGSGGNRRLGLSLFHWLSAERDLVTIDAPSAPDQRLSLPAGVAWLLPAIFLGGLPLALIIAGVAVWWHRRRL